MHIQHETSYGVIPLTFRQGEWEVFLVKSSRGDYWSFPKGKPEDGETAEQTATRELDEETQLSVIEWITQDPMIQEYDYERDGQAIRKKVYWYLAKTTTAFHVDGVEIVEGRWAPLSDAEKMLTFDNTRDVFSAAKQIIRDYI